MHKPAQASWDASKPGALAICSQVWKKLALEEHTNLEKLLSALTQKSRVFVRITKY